MSFAIAGAALTADGAVNRDILVCTIELSGENGQPMLFPRPGQLNQLGGVSRGKTGRFKSSRTELSMPSAYWKS